MGDNRGKRIEQCPPQYMPLKEVKKKNIRKKRELYLQSMARPMVTFRNHFLLAKPLKWVISKILFLLSLIAQISKEEPEKKERQEESEETQ